MSRKAPTLAEALKVPTFRCQLEATFVDRMAVLEALVAEHGKPEGVKVWAADEVRTIRVACATGQATSHTEQIDGRDKRLYLNHSDDRRLLETHRRKLARWWLAQGVGIEQARTLVPS